MISDVIAFTKVKLPFGWLGNMSAHPITVNSTFPTAEHLFQVLRFDAGSPIRELIRTQSSPMSAKMVAKKYAALMTIQPRSEQDVTNMRFVLLCKLEEHPDLGRQLDDTGYSTIIEDVSARPSESGLFWGMARKDDRWHGHNVLGAMWMVIRERRRVDPGYTAADL